MILERKNMKRSSNLGEFLRYTILNILGMAVLSWHWIKKKIVFIFRSRSQVLGLLEVPFPLERLL